MTSILSLLYVILSGSLKAIMANALTVVVVEYGSTLSSEQLELVWNDHLRLTYFSKVGYIHYELTQAEITASSCFI